MKMRVSVWGCLRNMQDYFKEWKSENIIYFIVSEKPLSLMCVFVIVTTIFHIRKFKFFYAH